MLVKIIIFTSILIILLVPLKFLDQTKKPEDVHIVFPEMTIRHDELVGYRTVSAYTLGNEAETDSEPCIGAYGDDLCALAAKGVTICASNEFEANTVLHFDDIDCLVLDRMNSRYTQGVDLAFTEYGLAKEHGLHFTAIYIVSYERY